jgi:hypothetical protein
LLGGPLLPGLGPVGLPPRLRQALARVGEFGFQAADGAFQVTFGHGGGIEIMTGVGQGPFGRLDLLLAAFLALGCGLSRLRGAGFAGRRGRAVGQRSQAEAGVVRGAR